MPSREQGDVGVGERAGDVGAECRPAGDVPGQIRGQAGDGGGAQGGDPSRSTIPDSPARMGTTAMAALPSADSRAGCGFGAPKGATTACIRSPAAAAAFRSAEFSAAPSTRLTTTISGTRSPPGNWRDRASALAESERRAPRAAASPAAAFPPIKTMKPIPNKTMTNASCHERRPLRQWPAFHTTMASISVT